MNLFEDKKQVPDFWGDGHSHSYWSDGFESIEELSKLHRKFDMDFRFQTDHCAIKMPEGEYIRKDHVALKGYSLAPENFARYLESCRAASDGNYLVLPGVEYDLDYGAPENNACNNYCHFLAYGFNEKNPIPGDGWFKSKSLLKAMRDLRNSGLIVGFAHTDDSNCFIPWQALSDQFDFIEINHNRCYIEQNAPVNQCAIKCGFWDKWLCSGLKIPVSTGSDCHQADMGAFGMRIVLNAQSLSEESILKSIKEGRSYLSGTFHPNIYLEEGLDAAYWFSYTKNSNRNQAVSLLEKLRAKLFDKDYGRILKSDYPAMNFTLEGVEIGDTAKINGAAKIHLEVNMHIPIQTIDLISDGQTIKRYSPMSLNFQEEIVLDELNGNSYLRIQAEGIGAAKEREWLISNPIYIRR